LIYLSIIILGLSISLFVQFNQISFSSVFLGATLRQIGIRAQNPHVYNPDMQTRSGRHYNVEATSQHQQETMDELLNQFHLMNNRMDMIWNKVFDKPEGSVGKSHNGDAEGRDRKEKSPMLETVGELHTPYNYTEPRFMQQSPPRGSEYHHRLEGPGYTDRGDTGDHRMDEAARCVRVDVPNFHGKLEPDLVQVWIMAVEDYFEWLRLSLDRQVRFVKMKLKNQARVWWHSVEEHLRRLKQPAIID
jgi:hypothetical protein